MIIGLAVTWTRCRCRHSWSCCPPSAACEGAAFEFGWLVSLALVVTVTVLATGNNPPQPNTAASLASLAVKIALGVGLVAIAVRTGGG